MSIVEPEFSELDGDDVHALLARNHVGRVAFVAEGQPEIRPLHYVLSNGHLYGRTSPGGELARSIEDGQPVVVEVDEVEAVLRWKSVIVRGRFEVLSPEGAEAEEWAQATRLLRRVIRDAFGEWDPVPERSVVFRISIEEATGRASA